MRVIQHCATYRCISWLSYRDGEFHLPFVAVQYCRSAVHGENDGLQQNLRVPYPNASVIALVAHGTTTITVHGGRTSSSMVTASKCYSGRSLTWTPAAATPSCIHHCNHRPSPISSATVLRLRGISRIQAAGEFSAGPSCTLPRHEGVLPLCTRGGAWHRGCVASDPQRSQRRPDWVRCNQSPSMCTAGNAPRASYSDREAASPRGYRHCSQRPRTARVSWRCVHARGERREAFQLAASPEKLEQRTS